MNQLQTFLGAALISATTLTTLTTFAQGTAFTYQGRLNDGASPVNGRYDLQFTIHDALSGGSQIAGPLTNANLAVSNGLFAARLDFGAGPFTGQSRWLEIGVRTNGIPSGFAILSPRQELTPVPYALMSANLLDGLVTSNKLAAGAVTTPKLADGSVTSAKLAPGVVITNIITATNNLALGTTNLDGRLDVYRTTVGTPAISLFGSTNQISTYGDDGLEQIRLWGPTYGEMLLHNSLPGNQIAVNLSANSSLGGTLSLNGTNGLAHAFLGGSNVGGVLNLFAANGTRTFNADGSIGQMSFYRNTDSERFIHLFDFGGGALRLNGDNEQQRALLFGATAGGSMLLHNSSNAVSVDLRSQFDSGNSAAWMGLNDNGSTRISFAARNGSTGQGGLIGVQNRSGISTTLLTGDNGSGDAVLSLNNSNGQQRASLSGVGAGGGLQLHNGANFLTVNLQGQSPGGSLQLLNNLGLSAHLRSGNQGGGLLLYNSSGSLTVDVRSQFDAGNVAAWIGLNDFNGERISFAARNGSTGAGGLIGLRNGSGVATILIAADDGAGKGRVTTSVLQITGGSDLSEQFDVGTSNEAIQPGMVVCIDAENPGKLVMSSKAYDRAVAGIVSGAGGVSPGMLMGHQGTLADGKHPIALSGRVYCLADATTGAIQPGDLLTTSPTLGHAMKAADAAKAQGAIIGKAMTALKSGKGLVLVLVSLQ